MASGGSVPFGSIDRKAIGDNLIRSHSAAPSLDGRLSVGPPPGLANSDTPLASNRSDYLQPALSSSRIRQLGQRRPASTGIIGDSGGPSSAVLSSLGLGGSSNGAVRPAAKTLMDLIQEDFPPESPLYNDPYTPNTPRESNNIYLERPRTTSPLSQQSREQFFYSSNADRGGGGLTEALDRLQIQGDPYNRKVSLKLRVPAKALVVT